MPGYVGASLAELLELLRKARAFELNGRFDDGEEIIMCDFIWGETYDLKVAGEETSSFLETN